MGWDTPQLFIRNCNYVLINTTKRRREGGREKRERRGGRERREGGTGGEEGRGG